MHGRARAPAAGTVLNALATGIGSAFAIDECVTAAVALDEDAGAVTGTVEGHPDADTALVERCVELVTGEYGTGEGGTVTTGGEVPMAAGLKSSSAAANATVLATLDALDVPVAEPERRLDGPDAPPDRGDAPPDRADAPLDRLDAARIGVRAARDAGVTVTGAFDDASASMLGGVTVTDNDADELLAREAFDRHALVWTPPERAYSADADVDRCRRVAPVAETVADLALDGAYGRAMTVNGFAFCAALGFPAEPLVEALPAAEGVSLSGTGPSYVAVGEREALETVRADWAGRDGRTWLTETRSEGATTG